MLLVFVFIEFRVSERDKKERSLNWLICAKFWNYRERVTHGFKNKGREVNKTLNVAIQDSNKPRIFVGKRREEKRKKSYKKGL